ncbi:hypothetical protein [Tsukamurella paurometabola]|uniref:DoxX family protein n=1 Tax=Tsukamurella paurometabola TaxID=2061 RepID=A0A3P8MBH1_TSUPA|nr:hypothetical protein [Tsukamurella paurometabola]UEA82352.1 hypothetical protein LK411_18555 [Tsukamurella paurometabola]VDR39400.1 Uncharacterised protein [Tsukamurella paurometabola]
MTIATDPVEHPADDISPAPAPWTPARKVAFRLLFTVGGGLVVLSVFGSLLFNFALAPVQTWFGRLGAFLSGTGYDVIRSTASGDSAAIWQYHFGWAATAVVITAVWTLLDRRSTDYRALGGLLWQVGRIALASGMLFYGLGKAVPSQFVFMQLPTYALQPAGDISRMNMLWGFMGASDGYSIVTGLVEVVSGLLLLSRRTWILGALGSIVSMVQVVLMDTFYNVPVKFLAVEFLVIAIAMLAPQWLNLIRVTLGRAAGPMPGLWRAAGADRTWLRRTGVTVAALIVAVMLVLGTAMGVSSQLALKQPRTAIDGVWTATSVRVDGREAAVADRPWINVAITYRGRGFWEKVGDGWTNFVSQDPTGAVTPWFLEVGDGSLTIKARKNGPESVLSYAQPDPDRLTLSGTVDGRPFAATYERRAMARASEDIRITHPAPDIDAPVLDFP